MGMSSVNRESDLLKYALFASPVREKLSAEPTDEGLMVASLALLISSLIVDH
jgi:hypothetical protein